MAITLGVLDQSPIRRGGTAAEAIEETLQLAQATERLGYTRYWLAEHHNSTGLACAAPEILIPRVASVTSRIRVGSGGVMLPHYSTLKVAEQFRMLETMFPGRIDLGLGRAPGTDGRTSAALAQGPGMRNVEHYPRQVADLMRLLRDELPEGHPLTGIHAQPRGESVPTPWLLGSSLDSASTAAEQGLPFSFAHFIHAEWAGEAITLYRRLFRPSQWLDKPLVNAGVSALCAETDEEAERLAMSRWLWRLRNRQGLRIGVPPPDDPEVERLSQPELDFIEYQKQTSLVGGPQRLRDRLEALAVELEVDEFVVVTITYDYDDRLRSYELLAEEFGLSEANSADDRSLSQRRPVAS
ncbi:MAG: LLM class flavin-dependent oxidoreductase [Chloroflexi bacterium]|nr:LLM class flavin-dependent oxidoreductase [Chloroflexota bacterium]